MIGQEIIRKVSFMWTMAGCFALRATWWLITFESLWWTSTWRWLHTSGIQKERTVGSSKLVTCRSNQIISILCSPLRLNLFKFIRNWFIFNQPLIIDISPRIALDTQKASTVRFHLLNCYSYVTCIVGCHWVIYSFSFESSVSSLYSPQKCFYFVQVIFEHSDRLYGLSRPYIWNSIWTYLY